MRLPFVTNHFIFIIIQLIYLDSILWVISRWFSSINNSYGLMVLCLFFFLVYRNKIWLKLTPKPDFSPAYFLIFLCALVEILNLYFLNISILSASLWIVSTIVYLASYYRLILPQRTQFAYFSLLMCSLPILPILNMSFGYLLRQTYASLIHFLFFWAPVVKKGTSLITHNYVTHIDYSCSGMQGIYVLFVLGICLNLYYREHNSFSFAAIYKSICVFVLITFLRVTTIFILHNIYQVENLNSADATLSIVALATSIYLSFHWSNKSKNV